MAIELTEEMRENLDSALTGGAPALLATASGGGMPDVTYKGSLMVFDGGHLAYWERSLGTTLQNLRENPQACVMYRNPQTRVGWKFFGAAELYEGGPVREAVMERTNPVELNKDPDRKGVAVVIRVDRVLQAGKVLMSRD